MSGQKRLRVEYSAKFCWKDADWYRSGVKDAVGPYYVDIPIGLFDTYFELT